MSEKGDFYTYGRMNKDGSRVYDMSFRSDSDRMRALERADRRALARNLRSLGVKLVVAELPLDTIAPVIEFRGQGLGKDGFEAFRSDFSELAIRYLAFSKRPHEPAPLGRAAQQLSMGIELRFDPETAKFSLKEKS